jgi:membrane protein
VNRQCKKLFVFALYLTHAGTANAFGAADSLAVLLMWLYFAAAVLLLGAEFSAAWARDDETRSDGERAHETTSPPTAPQARAAPSASSVPVMA